MQRDAAPRTSAYPIPPNLPRQRSHIGMLISTIIVGVLLFSAGTGGMFAVSYTSANNPPPKILGPPPEAQLANNPFNRAKTGTVTTPCRLPRFDTDVASQDAYYKALVPCLMRAWTPALKATGMPIQTPRVVTTGTKVTSPCGTKAWNQTAMYCAGDHTIYMTARHYSDIEHKTEAGAYLGQFAHEFGHAVQDMAGINASYGDAAYDTGGYETPAGLDLTRRTELQATCFEGMALAGLQHGGLDDDTVSAALKDSSDRGDEHNQRPDHGSKATNNAWLQRKGFSQNESRACNTWAAQPHDVR